MDKLETQLAELEYAQLVRRLVEEEPTYAFKHILTQETAYSSLLLKARGAIHRRVAEAYERLYADRLDGYFALLTQHYIAAGEDLKVLYYATRAGDVSARVYANAEAITYYSLALAVARSSAVTGEQLLHLFTKRGRALELSDQYQRALDNYEEMQSVALARGDRSLELQSISLKTNIHATGTPVYDSSLAQELADRALALARELGDRTVECKVLWNLLTLNRYAEQNHLATEYGEQALTLARELGLSEQIAYILADLGGVYMSAGQLSRAQVLLEESLALWRDLGNQPMLADNLMLLGTLASVKGDYDRTLLFTGEGIEISRKIGSTTSQSSNLATQMEVWSDRGDLAQALRLEEELLRTAEKVNTHLILALGYSRTALLYATIGAFEHGLEHARRARTHLDYPIPPFFRAWVFANLSRVYCASGDLAKAEDAIRASRLQARPDVVVSPLALSGAIAVGELALARGEFVRAAMAMDELAAKYYPLGVRMYLGEALYLQAQGLRGQGKVAQAFDTLKQARAQAETLSMRRILWKILAAMSEIEKESGNAREAQKLRADAQTVVAYIAEHTPVELRASFLHLPQVRQLLDPSQASS